MVTLDEIKNDDRWGDWSCAFSEAGLDVSDVEEVIEADTCSPEGYGSTNVWGVFKLKSGKYAGLWAWCDTTGWDCRAGGEHELFNTEAAARAWVDAKDKSV